MHLFFSFNKSATSAHSGTTPLLDALMTKATACDAVVLSMLTSFSEISPSEKKSWTNQ